MARSAITRKNGGKSTSKTQASMAGKIPRQKAHNITSTLNNQELIVHAITNAFMAFSFPIYGEIESHCYYFLALPTTSGVGQNLMAGSVSYGKQAYRKGGKYFKGEP